MTPKITPITPDEVVSRKQAQMPEEVIAACNEVIAKYWNGHESTFTQDSLIELILFKMPESTTRQDLFDNKYLEIEDIYRAQGWVVEYDKPGYNEDYAAKFTFKKK